MNDNTTHAWVQETQFGPIGIKETGGAIVRVYLPDEIVEKGTCPVAVRPSGGSVSAASGVFRRASYRLQSAACSGRDSVHALRLERADADSLRGNEGVWRDRRTARKTAYGPCRRDGGPPQSDPAFHPVPPGDRRERCARRLQGRGGPESRSARTGASGLTSNRRGM